MRFAYCCFPSHGIYTDESPVVDQWGNACSYIQSNYAGTHIFITEYISLLDWLMFSTQVSEQQVRTLQNIILSGLSTERSGMTPCSYPKGLWFHFAKPWIELQSHTRTSECSSGTSNPIDLRSFRRISHGLTSSGRKTTVPHYHPCNGAPRGRAIPKLRRHGRIHAGGFPYARCHFRDMISQPMS